MRAILALVLLCGDAVAAPYEVAVKKLELVDGVVIVTIDRGSEDGVAGIWVKKKYTLPCKLVDRRDKVVDDCEVVGIDLVTAQIEIKHPSDKLRRIGEMTTAAEQSAKLRALLTLRAQLTVSAGRDISRRCGHGHVQC